MIDTITQSRWPIVRRPSAMVACLVAIALLLGGLGPTRGHEDGRLFGQTRGEFATRRAAIRAAFPNDVVLLCGPGDNGDVGRVRFRTSDDLMYLTGVEAAGACLALLPDGDPAGHHEILFVPRQSPGARRWSDPVVEPGTEAESSTGIESVRPSGGMWDDLAASIRNAAAVRVEGPADSAAGILPDGSEIGRAARYYPNAVIADEAKRIKPGIAILGGLDQAVGRLRRVKSPGEIADIRSAIAATGDAERAAARTIRPGVSEVSVEGVILAAFRRGGAVREAFPCIVGSGPNSTVLHHFAGDRQMRAGDAVVVDIGAEYDYYAADITRTFPAGGRFTPRQRRLYQLVLDTQTDASRFARPGMSLGDLHQHARQFLRNSPLRGLDAQGASHTMDYFFVHGLGHFVGMDVHDVMGGSAKLDPGVVFTIEPGVYIPSEGIGIRIEDDYLVTPTGIEKLSAGIPSGLAETEAMMRGSTPAKKPPARSRRSGARRR